MTTPKPCPTCGSTPIAKTTETKMMTWHYMKCTECSSPPGPLAISEELAIALWNHMCDYIHVKKGEQKMVNQISNMKKEDLRLRTVKISKDLVTSYLSEGMRIVRSVECTMGLPPDARLVHARFNELSHNLELTFSHPSFDLIEQLDFPVQEIQWMFSEYVEKKEDAK